MEIKKTCTKCGEEKELDCFAKARREKDNLQYRCRVCSKIYRKEHREETAAYNKIYQLENKEKIAAIRKIYDEEHKEDISVKKKIYYGKNKDKIKTYRKEHRTEFSVKQKIYCAKNKKKIADRQKIYAKKHAAEINTNHAKRRARKLQATPSWADQDKIKEFYKEAHRLTEATGIQYHVDHIYPLQGKTSCGLHHEANLQIITSEENSRKSNLSPEQFYNQNNL
jgi:hypothetical protein